MSSGGKEKLSVSCPSCGKKVLWEASPHRPFCSERCKLADLGKWLDEDYRITSCLEDESEKSQESEDP